MTDWRPLSTVLLLALIASGCVQFQPAALYSGVEPAPEPERPRKISLAVEPVVYQDQNDDTIWFEEEMGCTQGEIITDVVYEGERAVSVSWDRGGVEGCEWAGFGIGWDGWAGKNLSELVPYAAFQMRVRSQEGRMYGLPIVLTLEDYAGGMGFAYTGNGYFERTFIDEEWQTVTVPFSAFETPEAAINQGVARLDLSNIKQLMFELQQSGSIYLDDIEVVYYEPPVQEPWITFPERPDPTALPIQLFSDAFINDNGWGLVTDACQSIQTTSTNPSSGSTALHLKWDVRSERCYEGMMGVSWDGWHPVDVTPIATTAAFQFDVRLPSVTSTQLPLRVSLEDYARRVSQIILDARYTPSGEFTTEWQTVTIPFSELRGGGRELAAAPATVGNLPEFQDGADLRNIKQAVFFLDEEGEVFIDNIRLVASN